jgi:hypothetical protein
MRTPLLRRAPNHLVGFRRQIRLEQRPVSLRIAGGDDIGFFMLGATALGVRFVQQSTALSTTQPRAAESIVEIELSHEYHIPPNFSISCSKTLANVLPQKVSLFLCFNSQRFARMSLEHDAGGRHMLIRLRIELVKHRA